MSKSLLKVNNIEVVYNHVILALRGVTLDVPEGKVVSLLGANGSGKTTTLKACSNLLHAERGAITKGSIEYQDKDIADSDAYNLVKDGVVQVLEGENAIKSYRALMGATNPEEAEEGTLRKLFAESLSRNAVHGSDSQESAAREIAIMSDLF